MSANPEHKTVRLGDEYDRGLQALLKAVIRKLGGKTVSRWNAGYGSQDVTEWTVEIDGTPLVIEAETYMGITITGEAHLVDRVAQLVRESTEGAEPQ